MNDANYAVLNYLKNEYGIKDVSIEGVEDLIFNFKDLLLQEQHLFNSIMVESIDFNWVSEQLTEHLQEIELQRIEALKEDYLS